MKTAVINVLVDYVLRINDNKLNRGYVEAIAGGWIRSNIETASQAMERAEKEHKKNQKKVFKEKTEDTPVWFDKNNEATEIDDSKRDELESLLKDFR